MLDMNKLSTAARVQVIAALVEGCSINSTVRMTGVSKPTILKLLADARHADKEPTLQPDAKSQVTLRYANGMPPASGTCAVS